MGMKSLLGSDFIALVILTAFYSGDGFLV